MLTKVNHRHLDPIIHASVSLEILLGIHRTHKHTEVLTSPAERKPWLNLKDFNLSGLANVRTRASEEYTDLVFKKATY